MTNGELSRLYEALLISNHKSGNDEMKRKGKVVEKEMGRYVVWSSLKRGQPNRKQSGGEEKQLAPSGQETSLLSARSAEVRLVVVVN